MNLEEDRKKREQREFRIMNGPRQAHLVRLLEESEKRIREKYFAGQREHGGNLWQKEGILEMAIDEAVDMLVYLLTLKEQMDTTSSSPSEDDIKVGGTE